MCDQKPSSVMIVAFVLTPNKPHLHLNVFHWNERYNMQAKSQLKGVLRYLNSVKLKAECNLKGLLSEQ